MATIQGTQPGNDGVTERQADVLNSIARGVKDVSSLSNQLNLSNSAVRVHLRTLRNNGLIEGESGALEVTSDGQPFVTKPAGAAPRATRARGNANQAVSAHRAGSKIAQAADAFNRMFNQGRQAVLGFFTDSIGLSPKAAATYYQNLRHEHGMAFQQARGQGGQSAAKTKRVAQKATRTR